MKKLLLFILILFVLISGIFLIAKSTKYRKNNNSIIASFYPLYFLTNSIIGEKVYVQNLTPAGVEPHDFEPSPKDFEEINTSSLVFLIGNNFEPWIKNIPNNDKKYISIGRLLSNSNDFDPHFWLSPKQTIRATNIISKNLKNAYPNFQNLISENTKKLIDELNKLDKAYSTRLTNCRLKEFVTGHKSFSYLAKDYGLKQISISGLSPEEEPSSAELTKIVQEINKYNIEYIHTEKYLNPKHIQTIASETKTKILVLDPIEGLSDEEIKDKVDYFTIMYKNLDNLVISQKCQ